MTKKKHLKPGDTACEDRMAQLLEALTSGPADGIGITDLCARFKMSATTAGKYLRMLELAGKVEKSHPTGGHMCRWGLPGIAARWEARRASSAHHREAYQRRMAELRAAEAECDTVVQRIVSATSAEPLRKPGPASVWELAV